MFEKLKKTIFFPKGMKNEEMFQNLFYTVNFLAGKLGSNIFLKENFTPRNFLYFLCIVKITMYISFNFYDIYLFRDDISRATFCVVTLGMVNIQCCLILPAIFDTLFSAGIPGTLYRMLDSIKFQWISEFHIGNN